MRGVALLVRGADDRVPQPRQEVHRGAARGAQVGEAHVVRREVARQHDVHARRRGDRLGRVGVIHLAHLVGVRVRVRVRVGFRVGLTVGFRVGLTVGARVGVRVGVGVWVRGRG